MVPWYLQASDDEATSIEGAEVSALGLVLALVILNVAVHSLR